MVAARQVSMQSQMWYRPPRENFVKTTSLLHRAEPGCHLHDLSIYWVGVDSADTLVYPVCPVPIICVHMISLQRSCPSEAHGKSFGTNSAETKIQAEQELKLTPERLPKAICETSPTVLFWKSAKRWWKEKCLQNLKGRKKRVILFRG